MDAKIISQKADVVTELELLGVPENALREAIEASERLRQGMNPNHPPMAHGFIPWSELVCALRDQLLPLGWRKSDEGNLPRVIHPNGKLAIAVLTGDECTGRNEEALRSKYPRGPRTRALIHENAQQLELGDLGYMAKVLPLPESNILLWYLMIRRIGDGVWFELSLPYSIGNDGHVAGWKKRIFFEPVVFEVDRVDLEINEDSMDDIDIVVTPKL